MTTQALQMNSKLPEFMINYIQRLLEEREAGKPVVWCSSLAPSAIFKAMGMETFFVESYGAVCGGMGFGTDLCKQAEACGYSLDLCSTLKGSLGIVFGNSVPEGLPMGGLPKPDIVFTMPSCPSIVNAYDRMSRYYDAPMLVMEKPRYHDELDGDEIRYLVRSGVEELQEIIAFLEKFTGKPFDYDRLQENVALEKKVSQLWRDAIALCRNVPAPMSVFDGISHIYPFYLDRGSVESAAYYQALKEELSDRVDRKIGAITDEKYRLYWDNAPFSAVADRLAAEGVVPVISGAFFNRGYPDLDPERPLETIVESMFFIPGNRSLRWKIDWLTGLVEEYSLDGMLMQRTRFCHASNMGQEDMIKAVKNKRGIPGTVLEGDSCDHRLYSESDINSKVDAFLEILTHKEPY